MPKVVGSRCPQDHPCPLVRVCPTGAISQAGFAAPVIDEEKCVECGLCAASCGYRAIVDGRTEARPSSV
jgi:Fe-S-cluster-containing hydrogenase component 2